jgi:hypothetical protein
MDKRLHLLETFAMRGDDGSRYVVHGYEHLTRLDGAPDLEESWQPTGQAEYRLSSGEHIVVDREGQMTVAQTGVRLSGEKSAKRGPARRASSGAHGHAREEPPSPRSPEA